MATDTYKIPLEDIVIDPLAMPAGADTGHTVADPGDHRPAQAGVRREHHARRVEPVASACRDRQAITAAFLPLAAASGLTSAIMDARSPQVVRAGQGRRPAARPRRLGGGLDRRLPRRKQSQAIRKPRVMTPAGRPALQRPAGAGAARGHPVRRGELERHRDRLHLRRPRHLQEMPRQVPADRARARQPRRPRLHRAGDQGRLAARLPDAGHRRRRRGGAAADHPAEGGDGRRRPSGDPPPGGLQSATSSSPSRAWPTRSPTWSGCSPR